MIRWMTLVPVLVMGCGPQVRLVDDARSPPIVAEQGDACDPDVEAACAEGLRCQWEALGDAVWTCVPHGDLAAGEVCDGPLDCRDGLECTGVRQDSVCAATGQPCLGDGDCASEDACRPAYGLTCATRCESDAECPAGGVCDEYFGVAADRPVPAFWACDRG